MPTVLFFSNIKMEWSVQCCMEQWNPLMFNAFFYIPNIQRRLHRLNAISFMQRITWFCVCRSHRTLAQFQVPKLFVYLHEFQRIVSNFGIVIVSNPLEIRTVLWKTIVPHGNDKKRNTSNWYKFCSLSQPTNRQSQVPTSFWHLPLFTLT